MILDASDTIEEFEDLWEPEEMDSEIWISNDGERIILYRYYDDEVDMPIYGNGDALRLTEEEFKFIFKDWIKVGNL